MENSEAEEIWDKQIKNDANAGKFDALATEALAEDLDESIINLEL